MTSARQRKIIAKARRRKQRLLDFANGMPMQDGYSVRAELRDFDQRLCLAVQHDATLARTGVGFFVGRKGKLGEDSIERARDWCVYRLSVLASEKTPT